MRSLTEDETRKLFEKLASYTGRSLNQLIASPSSDGPSADPSALSSQKNPKSSAKHEQYVFRLHKDRVYYCSLAIANLATSIPRANLSSLGTCVGKFTKTGKFRLHITALDIIAPHARYKVWVKPNGEGPLTYGNNVVKAHVGRWSAPEGDIPAHTGVVICGMGDVPLGFGVTARSAAEVRRLEPTAIVAFRQADVGEYLREEDTLFNTT
ncbi:ribosome biosynthesis protein nip7 [Thelotrema lepadinum]|nr:ribosome biosynthesis protein nip7 [Thelotrema lepadinum]